MIKKRHYLFIFFSNLLIVIHLAAQAPTEDVLKVDELLLEAAQLDSIDSAILLATEALILAKKENYEQGIISAQMDLANLHAEQRNFAKSLRNLLKVIPFYEKNENEEGLYQIYLQIGDIYLKEKLYEQALAYFFKARKLQDQIEVLERIETTYSSDQQLGKALVILDEIYEYYEEQNDYNGKVVSMEKQINNYLGQEKYDYALKINKALLELVTLEGDDHALAVAYNNTAYNYIKLNEPQKALDYFQQAKIINDNDDIEEEVTLNINMAICYHNAGKAQEAIRFLRAAEVMIPNDNFVRQCAVRQLIAKMYLNENDFYNADLYNQLAIEQAEYVKSAVQMSSAYRQAGTIHERLYEFEEALRYYTLHLSIQDSLKTVEKLRQQELLQQQLALERAEKEIKLYQVREALQDAELQRTEEARKLLQLERDNLAFQAQEDSARLILLEKDRTLQASLNRTKEIENQQEFLLLQQQVQTEAQEREVAELREQKMMQQMKLEQAEAAEKIKQQEIRRLEQDKNLDTLKIRNQQQLTYGIASGLSLVSLLIFYNLYRSRKTNKRLSQKNREIDKERAIAEYERQKSDDLLLNILPEPTAIELKEKGSATPKKYELATVIFTDFSGFTNISEQLSPEELISELSTCFSTFDEIIEQHGLEKIKTLGDGYMCVGGVPIPDQQNPVNAVRAALEMQAFMEKNIAKKKAAGVPYWQMRVGIHTGELVAGVVGSKKFAYDVWGDTVNIASRMESNGVSGKINISKATYELVKNHFHCAYRGTFEVKNKGEVEMYFVEN
ncbi:MAG: adenylate/guanylate cyclase domain-containing protein [Bacteroidota bacterium]